MMKRLIYTLLIVCAFCSCQDDDGVFFDVAMPQEGVSFRPVPGGAVMHYKLPDSKEVMAIRVRYKDGQGKDVIRTGSYACDSVKLIGFDEARQGVEAYVTLCDRSNVESDPVKITFDTENSGAVAFFDGLEVLPGWHGFNINWNTPQGAEGLVHIFYLGWSPFTGGQDTLLLGSYAFTGGEGAMQFVLKQGGDKHTVIIRTEDFRGYMVKEKVWKDVPAYNIEKLASTDFDFTVAPGLIVEDDVAKLGQAYLFDGDVKGESGFPVIESQYKTFLAGPNAIGEPFVLDFRTPRQIAQVKLYAMLYVRSFPYNTSLVNYAKIWHGQYQNKLPCSLTIYGTNNKEDRPSWVKLGDYNEDPKLPNVNRWCQYCAVNADNTPLLKSLEGIKAAEAENLTINVSAEAETYRYLILVVNDTYDAKYVHMDQNPYNYVTFHELEVYTKSE